MTETQSIMSKLIKSWPQIMNYHYKLKTEILQLKYYIITIIDKKHLAYLYSWEIEEIKLVKMICLYDVLNMDELMMNQACA